MGRYLLGVAPPMATLLAVLGCSSEAVCECATPGVTITIPAALAPSVTNVAVSDRACVGLTPKCQKDDGQGHCLAYHLDPTTYGNCHVDIALQNRTYSSDVRIVQRTGCCTGYFADPLAAGTIEVSHFNVFPGTDR
jgi:hypothetical protein